MTIRTALIATVHLIKGIAAERAARQESPPSGGGAADRFERQPPGRRLANADSGGGDPKGGTQIGW